MNPTPTRKLETTPAMVAQSMAAYSQMELAMCMDGWLVTDAGAAHELLALVRRLVPFAVSGHYEAMSKADEAELNATLEAAAPWLEV